MHSLSLRIKDITPEMNHSDAIKTSPNTNLSLELTKSLFYFFILES